MVKGEEVHLTVLMTTHQSERFLAAQLTSILEQERRPDLLLVADDGSSDGTLALLDDAAERRGIPVRVFTRASSVGLRKNIAAGLSACPPGVIVLADHDDIWDPRKLGFVDKAFAHPETLLWFSDAELIDDAGRSLGHSVWDAVHFDARTQHALHAGHGVDRLMYGMTVVGATMAFRTELLAWALPLPEELEGDHYLFLHDGWLAVLASIVGRVVAEPERLVRYRQHAGQVTAMSLLGGLDGSPVPREPTSRGNALLAEHDRLALVTARVRGVGTPTPRAAAILRQLDCRERFLQDRLLVRGRSEGLPQAIAAVARHVVNGDYHRFSRGFMTAAKDVWTVLGSS